MSNFEEIDRLYNTLFELSNEIRHKILLLILEQPTRMTNIANKLELTTPEVSRHLSRMSESKLIQKDIDNLYHLTDYGHQVLNLVQDLEFRTKNRDYFVTHITQNIPDVFKKRLSELAKYQKVDNFMGFLTFIDKKIKEANEYVWLCIDQYPLIAVDSLLGSVERGVKVKIIEPIELVGPNVTFEDRYIIPIGDELPDVIVKTHETKDVYLFISDAGSAVSFPLKDGFDYSGFTVSDKELGSWSMDVFSYYWEYAKPKVPVVPYQIISESKKKGKTITLEGTELTPQDYQAIQKAANRYDEVILKGKFNLGASSIVISKSVVIRGEGREEDIPLTKIYKSGWTYPILHEPRRVHENRVFIIDGEGIDVTIENIHFTDFDYNCIGGFNGNSLTIKNNRITLTNGFGRGLSSPIGNQVIGIYQLGGFQGGVRIEGNYLNFAQSFGPFTQSLRMNARADDPNYRPNLTETYSYLAFGIDIFNACGEVIIENNIVRNMNARGIVIADNKESANFHVNNNTIISEIYGAYFHPKPFAGFGIMAHSGWHVGPAPHIEILDNLIRCDKINYCGIVLQGPELGPKGTMKLTDVKLNNNRIHLEDGSISIFTESLENSQITGNSLTGQAYYGIGIFPGVDETRTDLGSNKNVIEDNTMRGLKIKDPDEYSKSLLDEKKYPGSKAGSATAYVWLNINTKENRVKVTYNETVIDEGINNQITYK